MCSIDRNSTQCSTVQYCVVLGAGVLQNACATGRMVSLQFSEPMSSRACQPPALLFVTFLGFRTDLCWKEKLYYFPSSFCSE